MFSLDIEGVNVHNYIGVSLCFDLFMNWTVVLKIRQWAYLCAYLQDETLLLL